MYGTAVSSRGQERMARDPELQPSTPPEPTPLGTAERRCDAVDAGEIVPNNNDIVRIS